jgi:hypothetical protein
MKMKSLKLSHLLLITIVIAALCMHLSTFAQSHHDEGLEDEGKKNALHVGILPNQELDLLR